MMTVARVEPPRELLCQRCDTEYVTWFAPNSLWNAVTAHDLGGRYVGEYSCLCPNCFGWLAAQRGYKTSAWVFTDEVAGYDAAALLAYALSEIARVATEAHEVYRNGTQDTATGGGHLKSSVVEQGETER